MYHDPPVLTEPEIYRRFKTQHTTPMEFAVVKTTHYYHSVLCNLHVIAVFHASKNTLDRECAHAHAHIHIYTTQTYTFTNIQICTCTHTHTPICFLFVSIDILLLLKRLLEIYSKLHC